MKCLAKKGWKIGQEKKCEVHPRGRGDSGDRADRRTGDRGQIWNRDDGWGGDCFDNGDEVRSWIGQEWGGRRAIGPG